MARRRRSHAKVMRLALNYAKKGPFTPQDLAAHCEFTPNRARQVLEELKAEKKVATLGNRRSVRGKPAVLWGLPGTKLTEADKAPRIPYSMKARAAAASTAASVVKAAGASGETGALVAILTQGLKIVGPSGEVYTVTLAGAKRRGRPPGSATKAAGKKAPAKRRGRPPGSGKKKAAAKKAPAKRRGRPPGKGKAAAKKVTAKRAAPKRAAPKKAAPKKTSAKKAPPKKAAAGRPRKPKAAPRKPRTNPPAVVEAPTPVEVPGTV